MIGIYKVTNPKGKIYVGQTVNIEERFRKYRTLSNKKQTKLYNSLKKYGPENHVFEILEECSIEQLDERETYWGTKFNVLGKDGLTLRLGKGRGSCSEATKRKISNSLLGKKKSEEHCKNLSESKIGIPSKRKGKPDLKQKGKPKPGAGGKGKEKLGAGPKEGKHIIDTHTGEIFLSVKECRLKFGLQPKKIYIILKEKNGRFKYK